MSEALISSLAEALGLTPAGAAPLDCAKDRPVDVAPVRPVAMRPLRLPEASEEGIGELTAARRARADRDLATPSSLIRRAQRDWPEQCERVRALAAEMDVQLGEAWRRVIAAGIDALSEGEAPSTGSGWSGEVA